MADKDLEFGRRLEGFIGKAGIKKKKLADLISVSPSAVGEYINKGRIPEAPILLKIAQSLNKTMEELLTGSSPATQVKKEPVEEGALPGLSPLERVYMDRLLEIIRTKDQGTVSAITQNIDTFLRVPSMKEEHPPFIQEEAAERGRTKKKA